MCFDVPPALSRRCVPWFIAHFWPAKICSGFAEACVGGLEGGSSLFAHEILAPEQAGTVLHNSHACQAGGFKYD